MKKEGITPQLATIIVNTLGFGTPTRLMYGTPNDDEFKAVRFIGGNTPISIEYSYSEIENHLPLNMKIKVGDSLALCNFEKELNEMVEKFNREFPEYTMVFEIPEYRADYGYVYFTKVPSEMNQPKRYSVGVQRIAYTAVEVEAHSIEEAKELALEKAYSSVNLEDYSFLDFELDEDSGVHEC